MDTDTIFYIKVFCISMEYHAEDYNESCQKAELLYSISYREAPWGPLLFLSRTRQYAATDWSFQGLPFLFRAETFDKVYERHMHLFVLFSKHQKS